MPVAALDGRLGGAGRRAGPGAGPTRGLPDRGRRAAVDLGCPSGGCANVEAVQDLSAYGQYPRDGAMVNGFSDGGIYRFAGGARLWISRCDYGLGCGTVYPGRRRDGQPHLRAHPARAGRRHRDPQRRRRRLLPLRGRRTAARQCDIGAGCTSPTEFDSGTLGYLGTATPGRPNMRPVPGRRHDGHERRRRQLLPLRRRGAAADLAAATAARRSSTRARWSRRAPRPPRSRTSPTRRTTAPSCGPAAPRTGSRAARRSR